MPLRVIAHRGASGYRPEHTRSAFELAIAQGADAIEVDVVATRDGVPIVRHDRELGATTDAARRLQLAARHRQGDSDGLAVAGWFAEDFDWADVTTLRARERWPRLRPACAAHDRLEPVLRLAEVARIAAAADVLLVIEIKEPTRSAALGLPLVELVLAELATVDPLPRIAVESFETSPLRELAERGVDWPLFALLDAQGTAPDEALRGGPSYRAELADPAGLAGLTGVSIPTSLVDTATVDRLHDAALEVWTWTLRAENRFLPPEHRIGTDPAAPGDWRAAWSALTAAGVDGIFTDHPDLAVTLRPARAAPRQRARQRALHTGGSPLVRPSVADVADR